MHEPVEWSQDQCPTSPRFGDVYRSRAGGWQQAQTVFLGGCHLPQRWQSTEHFTILETGFGLGLNFLATWSAWLADPRRCTQLHYVAVEAYPVSAADVVHSAEALSGAQSMPPLVDLAQELALHWQVLRPGIQQFNLAQGAIRLTLAIGDVLPMLQQLGCRADAVYLDGFNPAKNPEMWSDETLRAVAAHCDMGTTLASFSVASSVRSGLRQAGFSVRRKPGVAPKWHRLEASYTGVVVP